LALIAFSVAIYAFAVSQGLPTPKERGTIFLVWMLITTVVGSLLSSGVAVWRQFRPRRFVMQHPECRQLSHDQIQSWGTVISVVVAVVFGVMAIVLK
jgi:hypothetical protein